jgi:hypothetical protein
MSRAPAILAAVALLALTPGFASGAANEGFTGTLGGSAEVPPVSTKASGTATLLIIPGGTQINYTITYKGLSGPLLAANVHVGAAGANGPIMLQFAVGPSPQYGALSLASFRPTSAAPTWAAALNAIRAGNAYVNLRTATHPNGEIRAQLRPMAASASPTTTPLPTATIRPGATPTGAPTSAVAAATGRHSPPGTDTDPTTGREARSEITGVIALLLIGIVGGLVAVRRVRPGRQIPDED